MKFLIVIEGIPGGTQMSPEEFLQLAKANLAWAKKLRETKKVEAQYAFADHGGGFMGGFGIADYDSAEQLAESLATFPGVGLSNVRVYPLVGMEVVEKFTDQMEAMLKK